MAFSWLFVQVISMALFQRTIMIVGFQVMRELYRWVIRLSDESTFASLNLYSIRNQSYGEHTIQ